VIVIAIQTEIYTGTYTETALGTCEEIDMGTFRVTDMESHRESIKVSLDLRLSSCCFYIA